MKVVNGTRIVLQIWQPGSALERPSMTTGRVKVFLTSTSVELKGSNYCSAQQDGRHGMQKQIKGQEKKKQTGQLQPPTLTTRAMYVATSAKRMLAQFGSLKDRSSDKDLGAVYLGDDHRSTSQREGQVKKDELMSVSEQVTTAGSWAR